MHRCLGIIEIVEEICYYLQGSDLLSIALTRRRFKGIALSVLWQELPNLSPFIKCFPPEVWKKRKTTYSVLLMLDRPTMPMDWGAVRPYLPFVREIKESLSTGVSDELLRSLGLSFTGTLIFPNLRRLAQHFCTPNMVGFIKLCASPKLEHLDISFDSTSTDDVRASFISYFGSTCPNLKAFTFQHSIALGLQSPSCIAVSYAVQQWHSLRSLFVPYLSDAAMVHISQLPRLNTLILYGDYSSPLPPFPEVPRPAFPTIRKLGLYDASPPYFLAIHQSINSSQYSEFDGSLLNAWSGSDWFKVFTRLGSMRCQLTSITFLDERWNEELALNIMASGHEAEYTITPKIMRPALTLNCLQHLDMETIFTFDLTDDFVEEIALACPNLNFIHLGTMYPVTGQSKLTLNSYLCLVQHCSGISTIGLIIDASRSDLEPKHAHELSNHSIRSLRIFVGNSVIQDSDSVADFLERFVVYPHQVGKVEIMVSDDCDPTIMGLWENVEENIADIIHLNGLGKPTGVDV